MAGIQQQVIDFPAIERETDGHGREEPRVAGTEHRVHRRLAAVLEFAAGEAQLHRRAHFRVVVLRLAARVHRQQVGTGAGAAAVELQAQTGVGVDADADGARGIAGNEVQQHPVGPFLAVALSARVVQQVAVEIEVALGEDQATVLEKSAGGFPGQQVGTQGAEQQQRARRQWNQLHGVQPFVVLMGRGLGATLAGNARKGLVEVLRSPVCAP
ncbi:hypothetical protein D3C85_980400 [compost metagenome]